MATALYRESADIPGPHNRGALHSGDPTIGTEGVAILAKRINLDATRGGDFIEPIFVPPWSLVTAVIAASHHAFNQSATIQIGTTQNGTEVLPPKALDTAVMQYFQPATASAYMDKGELYLNYKANGATQGAALIVVQYVRL